LLVYIYIVIGDLIIKRGWGDLIIKRGWDIINRFNLATFFCLSQIKKWFPNVNWHSWQQPSTRNVGRGLCRFLKETFLSMLKNIHQKQLYVADIAVCW